jgi:hypothetical protein
VLPAWNDVNLHTNGASALLYCPCPGGGSTGIGPENGTNEAAVRRMTLVLADHKIRLISSISVPAFNPSSPSHKNGRYPPLYPSPFCFNRNVFQFSVPSGNNDRSPVTSILTGIRKLSNTVADSLILRQTNKNALPAYSNPEWSNITAVFA